MKHSALRRNNNYELPGVEDTKCSNCIKNFSRVQERSLNTSVLSSFSAARLYILTVISEDINSKTVFNIPKLEASNMIIVIIPKCFFGIMERLSYYFEFGFATLAVTNCKGNHGRQLSNWTHVQTFSGSTPRGSHIRVSTL